MIHGMDLSRFFIAPKVSTPPTKLYGDIKRYLLTRATNESLKSLEGQDVWKHIVTVVEKMEFVEHLDVIRKEIVRITENHLISDSQIDFSCNWLGHDFAGMHKDLEALEIYLLVSAIDQIMQKESFKEFYDWLRLKIKDDNVDITTTNALECLHNEYNREYGMTKGIKRGFCEFLDDEVKSEWVTSYYATRLTIFKDVVAMKDETNIKSMNRDAQLNNIVEALLSCRNAFTHSAVRQFECDAPFVIRQYDEDLKSEVIKKGKKRYFLLRKTNNSVSLIEILRKTVVSIANNKFLQTHPEGV